MLDQPQIQDQTGDQPQGLMRDTVYDQIRADILSCDLQPGVQLRENDLAQRYRVSKSPVRDALLRLQEQGLIEVLPRKGYRVVPVSVSDARELYEMRIMMEKACARRAIEEASDEELASLDIFRVVDADGLAAWVTYNRDFHSAVAKLSGNTRLAKTACEVIDQFDRLTFMGVSGQQSSAQGNGSAEKLVAEHVAIIDAIQARDKTKAASLIGSHIKKSRKRLFAVLENPPIVQ